MKSKENLFILLKIIKQHAVSIVVLITASVLFFVNFNNSKQVYASEQIAEVEMSVLHTSNYGTEILQQTKKTLAMNESAEADLENINVDFTSTSNLEFVYKLKNITEEKCRFSLFVNESEMENLLIKYFIKDESGLLTNYTSNLNSGEELEIKIVISIDNLAKQAIFCGDIVLTMRNLGE